MAYTLRYNHPHFPEGKPFTVAGLDEPIPNGGSMELSEDAERGFLRMRGCTIEDAFKGNAIIDVEGSSALDKSEVNSILAFFNPPEQEVPVEEEKEETLAFLEGGEE